MMKRVKLTLCLMVVCSVKILVKYSVRTQCCFCGHRHTQPKSTHHLKITLLLLLLLLQACNNLIGVLRAPFPSHHRHTQQQPKSTHRLKIALLFEACNNLICVLRAPFPFHPLSYVNYFIFHS